MTYKTHKPNQKLIPPHGGYKNLEAYKTAVVIEDGTLAFCKRYNSYLTYKTYEQMIGAARPGKQNIVEGSIDSGTSKKTELKLISVARGSFGELLEDFEDFLRQRNLPIWGKDDSRVLAIRKLAYRKDKSYMTYKTYIESEDPQISANTLICLIHQENYLLDQLLRKLEKDFLEKGGFTERLYSARRKARKV